eukprot:2564472-Pyramimonas_sp.AAC.3
MQRPRLDVPRHGGGSLFCSPILRPETIRSTPHYPPLRPPVVLPGQLQAWNLFARRRRGSELSKRKGRRRAPIAGRGGARRTQEGLGDQLRKGAEGNSGQGWGLFWEWTGNKFGKEDWAIYIRKRGQS